MTRIKVGTRIYFNATLAIGPGRVELLEGAQRAGSPSQPARDMDMSYGRAWLLMRSLNESLNSPASLPARGGRHGGGVTVMPFGLALIQAYRNTETELTRNVGKRFAEFARPTPVAATPMARA